MLVSLNINDEPLGYTPPVGPAVRFTVRYNQRDANQTGWLLHSNLGPKWTFDWLSYITDNPTSLEDDVKYYIMGGGTRTFTGFDGASFAFQQYDQTKLTRTSTSPITYEMLSPDGSKKIFGGLSLAIDSSIGISRKIFLTQLTDAFGNAVSLTYDSSSFRITEITDATIIQKTKIEYDPTDVYKITKVTDPFGRFATFAYDTAGRLIQITDVIGLSSQFIYDVDGSDGSVSDFIVKLKTPYGETSFIKTETGSARSLETIYPDGDRDRVELNLGAVLGVGESDPPFRIPRGMATCKEILDTLEYRNTFYWSKKAYASAYPDYTKAKIYHWLHHSNQTLTAGILESVKEPLESRVWYDYTGQSGSSPSIYVGNTNKPAHIGRVLNDGSTQLYTYEYNGFGNITKMVDPVGRTFSYIYADNGIDLLETRQTRPGQNELLSTNIYRGPDPYLIWVSTDAAGRPTTYTYNRRGQMLTKTNAKNEKTTYNYDSHGYLTSTVGPTVGPLPGASIVFTYDNDTFGQVHTKTDESLYTLTFNYDKLDRITKITFPDGTSSEYNYTLLDLTTMKDRAGRKSTFEYNSVRQMTKRTDPLNRVTLFQWRKCGALRGLTDPMGRTTFWRHDIQGRLKSKEYVDGSKVIYRYEEATSRLSQRIDEKLQLTQYEYNKDDTLRRIAYNNAALLTPPVAFAYDTNYPRLCSMTDGTGTTLYSYFPVSPPILTDPPTPTPPPLGAGQLASVDGPLQNDLIAFGYDELGRRVSTAISGDASIVDYDQAGRVFRAHNALGGFSDFNYKYYGSSNRLRSQTYQTSPNDQTTTFTYGEPPDDMLLRNITNTYGGAVTSEFDYLPDVKIGRIESWTQNPGLNYIFGYDEADQLKLASVSVSAGIEPPHIGFS
jgi:YD repeat-containing protein